MIEKNNYYIQCTNRKMKQITFEEAIKLFQFEYENSLNDNDAFGLGLDLIEIEENIKYISKSLSISIINRKISLEIFDDENDENYHYINPKSPIALTYYPNLIDENLHKVPLNMFTENKEFVYEVIKDFFDKGNTEKIRKNYVKNKNEIDKYL